MTSFSTNATSIIGCAKEGKLYPRSKPYLKSNPIFSVRRLLLSVIKSN